MDMPEDTSAKNSAEDEAAESEQSKEVQSEASDASSEKTDTDVGEKADLDEDKPEAPAEREAAKKQAAKTRKPVKRLARSVGMAMPSNKVRVFLGNSVIPPVTERKHFVAKLRKLDSIDITILEGDEIEADRNVFVGELGLTNIKLRVDGRAEVEIEFSLDAKGYLTVKLTDKIGETESVGKFFLPQFQTDVTTSDLGSLPVQELAEKIDLFEQQMQLLKGELKVRRERE